MITKLVVKYLYGKMVSSTKQKSQYDSEPWTVTSVHTNGTIRVECGSKLERLNIKKLHLFLSKDLYFKNLVSTFHTTLTLVVSNQKLSTHTMSLPLGGCFFPHRGFLPRPC